MDKALYAMLFWAGVPALALARRGRVRAASLILAALPIPALFLSARLDQWLVGLEVGGFAAAAALSVLLTRRALRGAARRAGAVTRNLRALSRQAAARTVSLAAEAGESHAKGERLQNRFALVQGMATRLDTSAILGALGSLWSDVPGVRRCFLLQRLPNGNWSSAFSHGFSPPEAWVRAVEATPVLTQNRRLRKYLSLDRFPLLREMGLRAPFYLIPIAWGEDVMALGCVEIAAAHLEESEAGFNVERKLVSIGLRRAFLYDLMSERSRHDGLTGVFLRRTFMERLGEAVRKSLRYRTPLFAALLDIDRFKQVNDTHGHPAGDRALIQLAQFARELSAPGVTVGRMGGDEFALILEMPSLDAALSCVEELRARVAATPVRDAGAAFNITISVGVSSFFPEKPSPENFLVRADEALYQSKRAGRNRVTAAEPIAPAEKG